MNREQLVEKAAKAICDADSGDWPFCNGVAAHRADAAAVVDAVLPQITTAEQLAAVTPNSWLVDRDGDGYQKVSRMTVTDGDGSPWTIEELLQFGPLTVVWQPS